MQFTYTEDTTCTDSFTCAEILRKKYEKLHKQTLINGHGSISILHTPNKHLITIEATQ